MSTRTENSLPTRASLISRLRDPNDQTSWRDFVGTYRGLIYNVARKSGFTDAEAQDIVQETFATVSRHMPEFRYDPALGSFKGWLLQITRSRIIDALRRKHSRQQSHFVPREEPLGTTLLESHSVDAGATLDNIWEEEWRAYALETAMERVKQSADARHFQLFHLHVVQNVPALQVVKRIGAELPEVYFAKYKISAHLKREIKRLERKQL